MLLVFLIDLQMLHLGVPLEIFELQVTQMGYLFLGDTFGIVDKQKALVSSQGLHIHPFQVEAETQAPLQGEGERPSNRAYSWFCTFLFFSDSGELFKIKFMESFIFYQQQR